MDWGAGWAEEGALDEAGVADEADCLVCVAEGAVVCAVAHVLGAGAGGLESEPAVALGADPDTLAVQAVRNCTVSIGDNRRQASNGRSQSRNSRERTSSTESPTLTSKTVLEITHTGPIIKQIAIKTSRTGPIDITSNTVRSRTVGRNRVLGTDIIDEIVADIADNADGVLEAVRAVANRAGDLCALV